MTCESLLALLVLVSLVLWIPRLISVVQTRNYRYAMEDVPARGAAIVFGAGLWRDGTPSPVLRDRVATAAELYFMGKVRKILLSGDNRFVYYNEPASMHEYALSLGVPEDALVLDYAGRRTYDTCYRARVIFGLEQAILVTQGFHLSRALYTCNALGLDAVGVEADQRNYRPSSMLYWNAREMIATVSALWDVHVAHPVPVLGEPEPIFPP